MNLTDNCVTSCFTCNRAKDIVSEEEFLNWIQKIYKYRNLQNG